MSLIIYGCSALLATDLWDNLWDWRASAMVEINKLSPLTVSRLKTKGMYHDGGGLYLRVKPNGGKFWVLRYTLHGKAREMGLGAFPTASLSNARTKATEWKKLLAEGKDPISARAKGKAKDKKTEDNEKTFKDCAEAYIDAHKSGWRNSKHAQQWSNTLEAYVYPFFGSVPVQDIDVALVMNVLEQKKADFGKGKTLWTARAETASRLRGRIELILDWAAARGYRTGENPARWRGHLENLLPHKAKVRRVVHQPALPYEKIGDFSASLKEQDGMAAKVLWFTILTACRTSEAIGATWQEIDLDRKLWVIPETRIKAGREQRVPLSDAAIKLLRNIRGKEKVSPTAWIFAGRKRGRPLSNMAMLVLLKRMKRSDITVHGFRSSFRDWAAEQTNFPREVAEAALAHAVDDKVEAAYRRGDLFEKRRQLMDAWARYCAIPSLQITHKGVVIPVRLKKI
ncbi:MAG: integrase arm-type DNA-binding domain-containing protein [Bdellovibrionales bacterium]